MECNKEEAIRAQGIAEKKMQNKDFWGARKLALKAQQLYPDLENISQMIVVCEAHCSAENKVYGNEKDWYGILKIEPTADEALIKKQYRKFALLLHPDKNKFAGAADAFKLIGEARRVLLDSGKRMLHDSKCKASKPVAPNWAPQQANSNSNVVKQPRVQNHFTSKATSPFTGFNPQKKPRRQAQPGFPDDQQTFWTACPSCSVRYQFYRDVINKLLWCQNCKKSFPGYEIKSQATPPAAKLSRPAFPQQKEVLNQGACGNSMPKVESQGNVNSDSRTKESALKTGTSEVASESEANENCGKVDVKINKEGGVVESKSSGQANGKRMKSCSGAEEDIAIKENSDVPAKQYFGCHGEYPRRSTRSNLNVSYNENLRDDNLRNPLKRPKCSGSLNATEDPESTFYEGSLQNGKESEKENGEIRATKDGQKRISETNVDSSSHSSPTVATDPETYEYPDPDFNDFDNFRGEGCFAVGQTWAVYDPLDAMPRFYARIRKVFTPGFRVRITWLEPDPDDEDKIKWVDQGLPVSCGKFKQGYSENTDDHLMFSHLVVWEKGNKRDTYKIYPRKGETWALFKNWDIKWHSDPDGKRKYEFEFVEVLSDYAEGVGVSVAYLGKVKGFSCIFCRTANEGMDSFPMPPNQLFRFSHRVPSFQMSRIQRKDVPKDLPKGSFELDPASLPPNLEEISVPEDLKVEARYMHSDISCSESPTVEVEPVMLPEGNTSGCQVNKKTQLDPKHISSNNWTGDADAALPSTPEIIEIPETEFYNFDGEKSPEKFQIGQIWALYSDEDGLPKYYALIKKINSQPEFKLHITWLIACPLPKSTIQWLDKKMPISCGMFRLQKHGPKKYTETSPFSHQLRVEHTDQKEVYAIFPRKGEVWALYKDWNAGITCSDLETCEYDMVEILEENDLEIKVLYLELVNGFKSVFKPQMEEGSALTMVIARMEMLRFSHQIPAFRLTEERGGSLRGYWELDPAALPIIVFCSS